LTAHNQRIETIYGNIPSKRLAGEQIYATGRYRNFLWSRAMIQDEPVISTLVHPAYYLYAVRS